MLIVYDMDKQKILIVGHATYTMSAFIGFLIDGPHEVFTAPDGREGLEILRQEQIDLAIAEMYVEDLNGMHFVKRVSAENIQTDILLRARSGFLDLSIPGTEAVSVFPIMRDKFLVKIKPYVPVDNSLPVQAVKDVWKTELESFMNEKQSISKI